MPLIAIILVLLLCHSCHEDHKRLNFNACTKSGIPAEKCVGLLK